MTTEPKVSHEARARVDITVRQAFAHSVMAQPDDKRDKTVARINRIAVRGPIYALIFDPMYARFLRATRRAADSAVEATVQQAILEAKADNPECRVNVQLTHAYDSAEMPAVEVILAPEPNGVEFFCDAEDCCKKGIMIAAVNTRRDIQSSEPALATARKAQLLATPR